MGCRSFIVPYGALRMSQAALLLLGGGMAAAPAGSLSAFAASAIIGGGGAAVLLGAQSALPIDPARLPDDRRAEFFWNGGVIRGGFERNNGGTGRVEGTFISGHDASPRDKVKRRLDPITRRCVGDTSLLVEPATTKLD